MATIVLSADYIFDDLCSIWSDLDLFAFNGNIRTVVFDIFNHLFFCVVLIVDDYISEKCSKDPQKLLAAVDYKLFLVVFDVVYE